MIKLTIKRIRCEKKMTQRELALAVGITREYLSAVENGQKVPSLALLGSIAIALGVSATELLSEQPGAANRSIDCKK
ncbi:MAG TPA: helix-turn-helix transcriptional regulator [Methylomusa anaerophila]|uniref:helix-turn-helix domain-containing protein n=1 Tax=Methylomusa anaerophila TaxID=1930071 RepID=UPI0018D52AA1|nr:helix-turn-helix transcriptional regulator [Methylomusa anaerophila]HML89869.1 helix-turn-helix transcriptional regulator [Methylomusa anaerophila]